jgi:hypothetical protein
MATATATAELEAAIAALSAKKQRLQDSFDRLAASAPIPIPFTWDDINAHISSLQSSIAVRFLKLQSLQLQPAAPTTTEEEDPVEHRGNEDRKPYLEHYTRGNEEEGERANGRVEGAIKASHGLELEKEEEDENENENENSKKTATASSAHRSNGEFAGGVRQDLVAACVNMDTSTLVDMLYRRNMTFSRARSQFLPALLGAAEPHALVVAAVRVFLVRTEPKNNAHWDNCGSLLHCARELTDEPSAGTLEQANRLAQDWKEMIGKPQSSRDLGRLAVWGLLRFLVLYNITLEFDASEIIHHLGCLPAKKKRHCIELCNHLGLIRTMTGMLRCLSLLSTSYFYL